MFHSHDKELAMQAISTSSVSFDGWDTSSEADIEPTSEQHTTLGTDPVDTMDAMDDSGSETKGITAGLGLVGAGAGLLAATTAAGGVAAVCATAIAVLKAVEVLADEHKEHGQPVKDPMARNAPIDKR
jgi:hypothetical protein